MHLAQWVAIQLAIIHSAPKQGHCQCNATLDSSKTIENCSHVCMPQNTYVVDIARQFVFVYQDMVQVQVEGRLYDMQIVKIHVHCM